MSNDELGQSRLAQISRNVTINGRRTSIRMEPIMWDSLEEICVRENNTLPGIIEMIDSRRQGTSLTASLRVFIISYFKTVADQGRHRKGGFSEDTGSVPGPGSGTSNASARIMKALEACGPLRRR